MATPSLSRILVVDDEPSICNMAKIVLEKIGNFTVQTCDLGSHALQVAPQFNPDLILLDVMMPGLDGPGTLKALRARPETAAIPIIFLTGKVQIDEIEHYKKLGALDVIPKPFDPMTLSSSVIGIWGLHHRLTNPATDVQEQLKILRTAYATQVPGKIEHLREKFRILRDDATGIATLMNLHLLTHSLAGSCETFGFSSIRKNAYKLELLFADIIKSGNFPSDVLRAQINDLLDELAQAGSEPPQIEVGLHLLTPPTVPQHNTPADGKLVFLVGSDTALAEEFTLQLGYFGYNLHSFEHLAELEEAVHTTTPAAIIMDTRFIEGQFNGAGTLANLQRECAALLPILFISDQADVDTRLRAVHAGGHAYFTKPVDINKLAAKLDGLISDQIHEPYRVLIVEDEPNLAKHYALTLEQEGMRTQIAEWVADMVQGLVEFNPDLVLMDLYLPGYNGIDLAGMIRQQEAYVGIPIVFLSSETDLNKQLEAMNIGADDFLTKPIDPRHLVSLVSARIHRARIMRSFMTNDSLTGLLNHASVKEQLAIEVARVKRNNVPLAVALVDIDHFKSVNDTYGHLNGDKVLKNLARLFKRRFRKTDVVGRYGGEEFAIILPNADGASAQKILDKMRIDFSQIQHDLQKDKSSHLSTIGFEGMTQAQQDTQQLPEQAELFVTFSAGIAILFPDGIEDASTLIDRADKALYEAKHLGRNRVIVAGADS